MNVDHLQLKRNFWLQWGWRELCCTILGRNWWNNGLGRGGEHKYEKIDWKYFNGGQVLQLKNLARQFLQQLIGCKGGGWRESCCAILVGRNQWNDPRKLLSPSAWVGFEYTCQLFIGRNPPHKVFTLFSYSNAMRPHVQCASEDKGSHSDQTIKECFSRSLLFLHFNI